MFHVYLLSAFCNTVRLSLDPAYKIPPKCIVLYLTLAWPCMLSSSLVQGKEVLSLQRTKSLFFCKYSVAPFPAGFGAVSLWFRAVHPGITRAKGQVVGRSMQRALGGHEDRGSKTVLTPVLATWAQIPTPSIKGACQLQRATARGRRGCTQMRLAGRWAAPSPSRCNGGASPVALRYILWLPSLPRNVFHQNCTA